MQTAIQCHPTSRPAGHKQQPGIERCILFGDLWRGEGTEKLILTGGLKLPAKAKKLETGLIYNGLFVSKALKRESAPEGHLSHTSLSAPMTNHQLRADPGAQKHFEAG